MHQYQHENEFSDGRRRANRALRPFSFPKEELSRRVNLRRWMSPIEDQGDLNTCTANAVAGICEYLFKRYSHRDYDVSRLFIYYNAQIISQRTHRVQDYGVSQRDIILGMRKYGFCQEKFWPYRQHLINTEPSKDVYRRAGEYTVVPLRIPCDIKAIETCLHHQIPVPVDIFLLNDIGTVVRENEGYLPLPDFNNTALNRTDLHTVLLVGYDRDTKHFIARNSWGGYWGRRGYFYLPYEYLNHRRLYDPHDGLWTILKIIPRTKELPPVRQLVLSNNGKHHRNQ